MKKLYAAVLLSIGLAGPTAVQAQVDYQPGYIVRPAGDTVRGEIDYRDARLNARQCHFRATPGAEATTFGPTELQAYGLRGRKQYRTQTLPASPAPGATAAPYFLEVLVSGPANLYAWRDDERGDHYYVATATFPLTELVQRKVLLQEQHRLQEQNIYRTTLAQALAGCPAAQAKLPKLFYSSVDLAQAVRTYNACQGVVVAKAARSHPSLGVIVGGQLMKMHINQSYPSVNPADNSLSFGPKTTAVVGLALNAPLSALSHKLSLEAELFYESESYDATFVEGFNTSLQTRSYDIELAYLRMPLLVRYMLPKGRIRPFLEAGATLAFALRLKSEQTTTDYFGKVTGPTGLFRENLRHFQQGLAGGVGVQFNYWQSRPATLLVRCEVDNGWADGVTLNTGSNRVYAMLTLGLGRAKAKD